MSSSGKHIDIALGEIESLAMRTAVDAVLIARQAAAEAEERATRVVRLIAGAHSADVPAGPFTWTTGASADGKSIAMVKIVLPMKSDDGK